MLVVFHVGFKVQEQRPLVDSIQEIPLMLQSALRPRGKVMINAWEGQLFVLASCNTPVNLPSEFSPTTKLQLHPYIPLGSLEATPPIMRTCLQDENECRSLP